MPWCWRIGIMSVAATLEPTGRAERVAPVRVGGRCPGRWAGWRQHEAWLDLLSRDQPCPPRTGSRLTGPPGPPCSIQRGSPPLCTPADGSLIPLPDRELAADARSAIELAVPTATVGDGLAIGNTRWLAPDLLDELEPGTRSGPCLGITACRPARLA